ncbi:hypothetical protein ABW19_dt0208913 [Dactylella cylindrospora]|nr:hypothetical protein ABW19_dt0208913 [Dactylella cylindrospora]
MHAFLFGSLNIYPISKLRTRHPVLHKPLRHTEMKKGNWGLLEAQYSLYLRLNFGIPHFNASSRGLYTVSLRRGNKFLNQVSFRSSPSPDAHRCSFPIYPRYS